MGNGMKPAPLQLIIQSVHENSITGVRERVRQKRGAALLQWLNLRTNDQTAVSLNPITTTELQQDRENADALGSKQKNAQRHANRAKNQIPASGESKKCV